MNYMRWISKSDVMQWENLNYWAVVKRPVGKSDYSMTFLFEDIKWFSSIRNWDSKSKVWVDYRNYVKIWQ